MAYIGKTPSQAVRSRYFYTAAGGETSLSGADDNGDTLIFADGNYVDVYLNGVLLVASSDYNVNTVNTIAGLTALTASDIVEIVVYDTFSVFGGVFQGNLSANTIATNSINLSSTTTVSSVLDEDTMTSDSATALATQQSIKAYVDTQVATVPVGDITEVTAGTGLTGGGTSGAVTLNIDSTVATLTGTQTLTNKTLGATSVTGNVTFGDNDKAIFGAGLQIYYNSSNGNSYIHEAGSGDLLLQGVDVKLRSSDDGANMLHAVENGSVSIYYNGSTKLATTSTGVDVTGTVTADGLTVDGTDTEAVTSQLLKVRNSTTGEAVTIGLYAKADNGGDGNSGSITFDSGADGSAANNELRFSADHQTDTNPALSIAGNGDISFYEDTGTTAKFFWDASAERLLVGNLLLGEIASNYDKVQALSSAGLRLQSSGGSVYLDSGGKVGIGTSSPAEELEISADAPSMQLSSTNASGRNYGLQSTNNGNFAFYDGTAGANRIVIDSSGSVGIGTSSPSQEIHGYSSGGDFSLKLESASATGTAYTYYKNADREYATGIRGSASDSFQIIDITADATRLTIDSSGKVGIGTSAVDSLLHLQKSDVTVYSATATDGQVGIGPTIYLENPANSNTTVGGQIVFGMRSTEAQARIGATGGASPALVFGTNDAERMRIDSSGNVALNGSVRDSSRFTINGNVSNPNLQSWQNTTSGVTHFWFRNPNGIVGSIVTSGSSTAYNTSSDYRLKENVTDITDATTRLKQLNPVRFNFIADADTTVDGFLAHEVQSVVPEAITGTHDEVDDEGNPLYQGIDQSKLVPLLVKTIQELEARITALETA